jgi:RNA polymerase sigma factor (sigma-70 family)
MTLPPASEGRRTCETDNASEIAISHSAGPGRLLSMRQQPFEAIVARYGPTVLRVCRAVLGPTAADDAWSETFLSAMQAYSDLRSDSNVEAWLVTIAHRKALDHLRAQSRRAIPTDDLPEKPSKDGVPGTWESNLWAALRALPLKQRETVAYHYLAGLPYADVAEVLGGSPDAARRAAADGIAALRKTYLEGEAR